MSYVAPSTALGRPHRVARGLTRPATGLAGRRTSMLRRRGFTLTEVLLVLAILGVIAAMVVPQLLGRQRESMVNTTKLSINALENTLTQYASANGGEYPTGSRDEVFALLINPGTDTEGRAIAAYLDKMPKDAWDQPLFYEYPNSKMASAAKPAIWSSGPNRQNEEGGGDDVNNWATLGK